MNITIKTKHTITVNATDMKKRFCEAHMDILNDSMKESIEDFTMDLNRFQDDLYSIDKQGFRQAFKDGHTMVLLGGKEFDHVEEWFSRNANLHEELVVSVVDEGGNLLETIQHEDLNY